MNKIIYFIPFMLLLACSSNTGIKGTSWAFHKENQSVTMTFKDTVVEIIGEANGEIIGEVSGEYSYIGDTILIGKPDNCDKAVIKGDKLLYIEKNGNTELKKVQ